MHWEASQLWDVWFFFFFSLIFQNIYSAFLWRLVGFQTAWNSLAGMCIYGKGASGDASSEAGGGFAGRWARPLCHLLFVEGAAPVRERAVLSESVGEFGIELVSQAGWDSLPNQDEDHNHRRLARVARSLTHQAEQLFLLTASADYLHAQQHTPQSPNTNKAFLRGRSKRIGKLSIHVRARLLLLLSSSLFLVTNHFSHLVVLPGPPFPFNESDSERAACKATVVGNSFSDLAEISSWIGTVIQVTQFDWRQKESKEWDAYVRRAALRAGGRDRTAWRGSCLSSFLTWTAKLVIRTQLCGLACPYYTETLQQWEESSRHWSKKSIPASQCLCHCGYFYKGAGWHA